MRSIGAENLSDNRAEQSPGTVLMGFAPSDLANVLNPGMELPSNIRSVTEMALKHQMGVELELEGNIDPSSIPEFTRPVFLGLHQPSHEVDTVSDDEIFQSYSIDRLKKSMVLAAHLEADYFTVHLETVDRNWGDQEARREEAIASLEVYAEMAQFYRQSGFNFSFLIENLEYPKFPATFDEIGQVVTFLKDFDDIPAGLVLDVGHLWRSRDLLHQAGYFQPDTGWSFDDYLGATLEAYGQNIMAVHFTGCRNEHTHLLPDLDGPPANSAASSGAIYINNQYDFKAISENIFWFAVQKDKPPFLVNEAFRHTYGAVIQNNHDINTFVNRTK